jgi:exodeoxyribonuclease (lambda-induced)
MRNFIAIECEQRSEEWRQARCGRATASRAGDVVAFLKAGGEAAARRDYRLQLCCERLTNRSQDSDYISDEMRHGIDSEPAALAAYEALTGNLAVQTGFLAHTGLMAGCSLDAHVGDFEIVVSLKCPKTWTHVQNLRDAKIPKDYIGQMLMELLVTGAKEYHFLSFDDRLPEGLQTALVCVKRDEYAVGEYERQLVKFLDEVDVEYQALCTMGNLRGQLVASVA